MGGLLNPYTFHTIYDIYGNLLTATDAKGVQSQLTYGSINGYTNLYPTQTKSAVGLPQERTATATYDFQTGLITLAKDVDNNVETKTEYDDLGRATKQIAAYNTANEIWTTTEYNNDLRRVISRTDLEVKGDGKKVGIQHFDELGRVRLARAIENIATENPLDEEDGIKVQTRYQYDDGDDPANSDGTYSLTSNPYRAATSTLATNEETMGWTLGYSDKTGRYSETETFEGATLPEPFVASNGNTNSTGIVRTDVDATRMLVTDQAGKQRISQTNALGQLTDVWEVKASDSDTESISFPNTPSVTHAYKTSYSYDTLNNLTTVNQGQQTRTFSYNSLSRLLSANNPESGLISYVYDVSGNLTKKTDARGIETNYVYDNINRVTQRSYNAPIGQPTTPTVDYTYYNSSIPYSKGRLTKVTSSVSTTEYTEYDIMGRLTKHKQSTDGETYDTEYKYNLSGGMIEQTYPSGRVVKNVINNDGELSIVQSKKNANAGYFDYAKSFTYNATGAVESMQLGNGKWESTTFNSRLQPTQIALGTVQNGTDKLDLVFDYGTTNNNGNVLTQTIVVPDTASANGFTAIQTYNYDELNRLQSAKEKINNATSWEQTFTFDRYGNKRFDESNTDTLASNCVTAVCNPTIDPATNKLVGYTFDNAGNTQTDANGQTFTYDAENKQILVKDAQQNTVGEYFYDGDGKRIKKKTATEETIFVYNASGQLVADYSTQISETPKVSYLTSDHLGSPRITTDKDGDVYTRRDFMPFGEEIDVNHTSERKVELNYATDEIRQKFTSYERDNETELDYAQARMFSSGFGRFTSPDPLYYTASRPGDPQQFNLYAYVRNNPLKFIDPSGNDLESTSNGAALTEDDRLALEKELQRLAPGTKVNADGSVKKAGFWKRVANRLTGHGVGQKLVSGLVNSDKTTTINVLRSGNSGADVANPNASANANATNGTGTDAVVDWNINQQAAGVMERTERDKYTANGEITLDSPPDRAVVLGHELIHALHITSGTASFDRTATHDFVVSSGGTTETYREANPNAPTREEFRTVGFSPYAGRREVTENRLRKELKQPLRVAYLPVSASNWTCLTC